MAEPLGMILAALRRLAATLALAALGLGAGGTAQAEAYRLAPRDRVEVQVFDIPKASGEFVIDGDGAIAIPMLGPVAAAGLTPAELAAEVAERLRSLNGLVIAPMATARVAEYRPIYVLGDVERPGAYPYAPQMAVVEALALAGGAYRSDRGGLRSAIADLGELDSLEAQKTRILLQLARLKAELSDADEVAYPTEALTEVDPKVLATLIDQENTLFRMRRDLMAERIAALSRLQDLYRGEIGTIGKQTALKERQIETYALERERLSRATAPSPRALELERSQADAESQLLELTALQQRAQQMLAQAEQDAAIVRGGRRSEAAEDFNELAATLARVDADLATARRQLAQFAEVKPEAPRALGFVILRRDADGTARELPATEPELLQPGDVLKVARTLGAGPTD